MIKGLHHNAYRCRDSEETRAFYGDFLGLKLVSAFEIGGGSGLHTFPRAAAMALSGRLIERVNL
jgi:catechol 2,3-dioxygenase-like lactoylglutathione lyase family enzyme